MEPKEKTNDKENLQINQQPKKTWQEPVMTTLDLNNGRYKYFLEVSSWGPNGSLIE